MGVGEAVNQEEKDEKKEEEWRRKEIEETWLGKERGGGEENEKAEKVKKRN